MAGEALDSGGEVQGDAEAFRRRRHLGPGVLVDHAQHVVDHLDHRHLDAEARHHERELYPDHPGADHDQAIGELAGLE